MERGEGTGEKIEEKSVTEEVGTEPVPLSQIVEEEEEALDLSSFPILFIDGEFIDIKDESTLEQKEDQKIETPKVIGIETIEKENEQKERIEKEKNPVVYILLAVFVILALVILLIFFCSKKGKREEKEDSLWDEKEEYSSILEILSEDKNEENV